MAESPTADSESMRPVRRGIETPTVAILTAIERERHAVREFIETSQGRPLVSENKNGVTMLHGCLPAQGGASHQIVLPEVSRGQADAAIRVVTLLHAYPSVERFIFVGVAGSAEIPLGHAIVASSLKNLFEGKLYPGDVLDFRGNCPPVSAQIRNLAEEMAMESERDDRDWKDRLQILKKIRDCPPETKGGETKLDLEDPSRLPKIHTGTIGTSNLVVDSQKLRDAETSRQDIVAFETESYGFSTAADALHREFAVIRGVSDRAARKVSAQDDVNQPFAAFVAAAAMGLLLSKLWVEHKEGVRTKVGVFLDVDRTLTSEAIQTMYAKKIGVEEKFSKIEKRWMSSGENTDDFNKGMIPLFQKNDGLTSDKAKRYAREMCNESMRPHWEDLLKLQESTPDVTIYLVSSGPSYFVRELADAHGIHKENVLCSEYHFGSDGKLLSQNEPKDNQAKRSFVEERKSRHLVTIGVGDNQLMDGPFLSHTTVRILVGSAAVPGYLVASDLGTVKTIIDDIVASLRRG